MAFLKPQSPMTKGSDYFYPLTTSDQVIMDGGYRLNEIVGKTKKSTIILYANGWSAEAPYCYSIAIKGLSDKVNMKMLPHFPEDFEGKQLMKEEIAKISFASRENNILTFECWDEIPAIDLLIDIEIDAMYPIKGASIEMNYSVVGGTERPTKPTKNMIWVNTDQNITNWVFSKSEPKSLEEGMIWFTTGNDSAVSFFTLTMDGKEFDEVYPVSAKQYVGGAWVDKTAKSYQNGEWVGWIFYAFKDGEIRLGEMYTSTPERLYISNGELIFKNSNGNGSWCYFTETLDLTGYRKMKAKIKQTSVFDTMYCALVSVTQETPTAVSLASIKARSDAYLELTVKDGVYHELETSVKGLSGKYYVEVAAIAYGAISEIWFE